MPEDKRPRRLIIREDEVLLWNLVRKLKHDKTFYAREKIKDYNW